MKILVTGAAGFIGSNFVRHALAHERDMEIVAFDALTYAGNMANLAGLEGNARFTFVKGDITAGEDVERVFSAHSFDGVFNFAAETHVDRSLADATPFVRANIAGVQTLLDACRAHKTGRFLQVSTDEVYGSLPAEGRFTEESPIRPNNPYSATKAAADFLVRAAHQSHKLDVVTTRCSNNFGPYQFPEKLIPLMVTNALEDKPLPVYGDGLHVRDWIFVEDHCAALALVWRRGVSGETYNIGGNYDVPNLSIVRSVLKALNRSEDLIRHVEDRPGHDRRYAMDCGKLRSSLGWAPLHGFNDALEITVRWYVDNREWWQSVRTGEYLRYYEEMYGKAVGARTAGASQACPQGGAAGPADYQTQPQTQEE